MTKNYFNFLQIPLFFVFLLILPINVIAQCAGNDVAITVCDIPNPSSQTIDLFSYITGTPTAGGTWTDVNNSGGLTLNTGVLNAQIVRRSGYYRYNYTVTGVNGCADNTATITVLIGGYSGVTSPNVSVCNDNVSFNLFQAFNGTTVSPQSNGTWYNDTENIPVSASIPVKGKLGTFQYTYTMPAIGSCPAMSSTAVVTMFRAPEPGTPRDLLLCGTDGLAGYTNLDLNDLLSGEDAGGEWSGVSLTSSTDHHVNLQEIFDNFGENTYNFTYTVFSDNSICTDKSAGVEIRLEKKLDFTGATVVVNSDICEPEISTATYTATLSQGAQAIPNGEYEIIFNVSGPNGGFETIKAFFVNGTLTFPVKSLYFQRVGNFTLTITSIISTSSKRACVNIINNLFDVLHVYPIPVLDGAKLTPPPTCQNKDAVVLISDASLLADGNYDIVYNITGDNFAVAQRANITVTGGNASFTIPGSLNANSGISTITITNITNTVTRCTNVANVKGNMTINPLPNAATVRVVVNDYCFNDPVSVAVSGLGTITNTTISYTISDNGISTSQTITLPVANGTSSFILPSNLLTTTGTKLISFTNLTNNTTGCENALINVTDAFTINPIPAAPNAASPTFCKVDGATVANLLPNGAQYKWYISATATTPLAGTYVLKSENYFVRETSLAGCTSLPTMITVTINDSPAPTLNQDGQNFCGLENPTIADLSNRTNVASTVVWYDAANNGNLLSQTTRLVDQKTYYGYDFPTATNCISEDGIEVTVSLLDCDNAQYSFFIPDGFSPNGDNVNDTFRIPDIEFLYPDYDIEIFNRYGNILFKGNRNKPDWDGKNSEGGGFSDGIAPNGVYFYVIHFNKDNSPPKQGRLYLNR